jgi:hypothetical protein
MNIQSISSSLRYVLAPALLLQAGFPLEATLYAQLPALGAMGILHHRGETLDLIQLLEIRQTKNVRVLVLQDDLDKATERLLAAF